jgi:hypothetical protein
MDSENKFGIPNIIEKFCTEDGKTITFEELQNDFLEMMANSQKTLGLPEDKAEQKIKFIIGVFLVGKKLFSRNKLNSEKATILINNLYKSFIDPEEPKEITTGVRMDPDVRKALLDQQKQIKDMGIDEEKARDYFGETPEDFVIRTKIR